MLSAMAWFVSDASPLYFLCPQPSEARPMKIGLVKETKDREDRIALTPAGAALLVSDGHQLRVEAGAGVGAGYADVAYADAGAELVGAAEAWANDLVLKVKEPLAAEYRRLDGQILFTFLHLSAAPRQLTEALLASGTTAIAYETVTDADGRLPLLAPMSAVAGSMAVTMGNAYLARINGGKGTLLSKLLGQRQGQVVIVGDGVVGQHAAIAATGMGAHVSIGGLVAARGKQLRAQISDQLEYFVSTPASVAARLRTADLVIGAVLVRGARAPHVISADMVRTLQPGSVIVDVSIDQGGCVETSRPTSHSDPVFVQHGVIHYCVTNMPGAYPHTATEALTNATFSYVRRLADGGVGALHDDPGLANGLNTLAGRITYKSVAEALDMRGRYRSLGDVL